MKIDIVLKKKEIRNYLDFESYSYLLSIKI